LVSSSKTEPGQFQFSYFAVYVPLNGQTNLIQIAGKLQVVDWTAYNSNASIGWKWLHVKCCPTILLTTAQNIFNNFSCLKKNHKSYINHVKIDMAATMRIFQSMISDNTVW